jgi:NAD(P)-dependent dehydrogenase (short-subunit alcohol dehydrogenase family)
LQNAGISLPETPIEDLPIEKFLSVMSINVTASVLCTKYATRLMKSQEPKGGRIINNGRWADRGRRSAGHPRTEIQRNVLVSLPTHQDLVSSILDGKASSRPTLSACVDLADAAAYTISKHAISGLTKSTSLDGRKYDIACCQLDIGQYTLYLTRAKRDGWRRLSTGNAATDMGGGAANGVTQADGSKKPEPVFDVQQVGDAIVFMAGLPLGANAFNVTLTWVPVARLLVWSRVLTWSLFNWIQI